MYTINKCIPSNIKKFFLTPPYYGLSLLRTPNRVSASTRKLTVLGVLELLGLLACLRLLKCLGLLQLLGALELFDLLVDLQPYSVTAHLSHNRMMQFVFRQF